MIQERKKSEKHLLWFEEKWPKKSDFESISFNLVLRINGRDHVNNISMGFFDVIKENEKLCPATKELHFDNLFNVLVAKLMK